MKTVVLADRLGDELQPLTLETCVAMLPVAGKTVLEHTLETLAGAGISHAYIAVSAYCGDINAIFGNGERWGMTLDYIVTQGEAELSYVLDQVATEKTDSWLILRGDVIRGVVVDSFIQDALQAESPAVYGVSGGKSVDLCFCRESSLYLISLDWKTPQDDKGLDKVGTSCIEIKDCSYIRMDSLAEYHQANLDAVAGRISGLRLGGRQTAIGLVQGKRSRVSPKSLMQGVAYAGEGSRVHPSAEFFGEVVLCSDVIIDQNVTLQDTVILPHTYVGELVEIKNAIVSGKDLIRVDTGAILNVTDSFLLADLRQVALRHQISGLLNRSGGLVLFLISLPLWFFALILSLIQCPQQPLVVKKYRGNRIVIDKNGMRKRSSFKVLEWATKIPVLRFLPWLWPVITGDLKLVGTLPISPEDSELRCEKWEKLADQAHSGIIGPTQQILFLAGVRSENETLQQSDAFYASKRTFWKDVGFLIKGMTILFSKNAWIPVKTLPTKQSCS